MRLSRLIGPSSCCSTFATKFAASLHEGFEQGPIRPPTECFSLKLRVTRNCPWNQCTFCPLYKGQRYSVRSVEDVKRDIDCIAQYVKAMNAGDMAVLEASEGPDRLAATAALEWVQHGARDVFLQDANSLLMDPKDLLQVLRYLRQTFPTAGRITSYARSHTVSRLSDDVLSELREAGLDRIHVGVESGSDNVLRRIRKGATQAIHIKAGQKVKRAGMELSVYIMPGLGGQDLSEEHAVHSAEVVNQTDPDFIRIRSLFVMPATRLHAEMEQGLFRPLSEYDKVAELGLFVRHLHDITSTLKSSDHSMNLLAEVDGRLPEDQPRMLQAIADFQALPVAERVLFQIGKRALLFRGLRDLSAPPLRRQVEALVVALHVTPSNVDQVSQTLLGRL